MSSDSQDDRSSSSDNKQKGSSPRNEENQDNRSRSRSRDRTRRNKRSDESKRLHEHRKQDNNNKDPRTKWASGLPEFLYEGTGICIQILKNDKVSVQRLRKAYNKYRSDWQAKQNQIFIMEHGNDAWFCEKYDPDIREQADKEHSVIIKAAANKFFEDYKAGYYKNLNLTIKEAVIDKITQALPAICDRQDTEQQSNYFVDMIIKDSVNIEAPPFFGVDIDHLTYFIKPIPTTIFKNDIKEEVSKVPGYVSIHMSEPIKKQNFIRYGWIVFADKDSFNKATAYLTGLCIKSVELNLSKSSSKNRKIRIIKNYPSSQIGLDCRTCHSLIKTLDEEEGIQNNPLTQNPAEQDEKHLDIYVLYLRRVHGYDYFTAQQFTDERSLANKVGMVQLRIVSQVDQNLDIKNVFKKKQQEAEQRAKHKKEKKAPKQELMKLLDDDSEMVADKSAWKCKYCTKKFVSSEFLLRHITGKHEEQYKKLTQKAAHQAYLLDENKITSYPQPPGRDDRYENDRGNNRGRRGYGGYRGRGGRYHYQDLDDPNTGKETENKGRSLVNFLDI